MIARFIRRALSEDLGGSEQVPGSQRALYVRESVGGEVSSTSKVSYEELTDDRRQGLIYIFRALNDGHELGIGWPHKWHVIIRQSVALRLAWFILWTWWAKGTWFGLKRFIYFRANRAVVRQFKNEGSNGADL